MKVNEETSEHKMVEVRFLVSGDVFLLDSTVYIKVDREDGSKYCDTVEVETGYLGCLTLNTKVEEVKAELNWSHK